MEKAPATLAGIRRELTKELFEELGALQCAPEEILGYIGTTQKKLQAWCRRVYRRPLDEMLRMIRQDGLIAIRRASFEQLKKSATIVSQQYNRFLPGAGPERPDTEEAAIRALADVSVPEADVRRLYDPDAE